jgi:serine/threonine-protein kinase
MPDVSLPLSVQLQLEEVCARFEAAWKAVNSTASAPRIEEYVTVESGPARSALLLELLRLDKAYRLRHGENPSAEFYAARCPADAQTVYALFSEVSTQPPLPRETSPAADRNLLLGVVALQMDFVSRDALIAAMHAWVLEKTKALGQILVDKGALAAERRGLLELLVDEHIKQHGNSPEKSLAAIPLAPTVRHAFAAVADPDFQASLHSLGSTPGLALESTKPYEPLATDGSRYRILRAHAKGGLGEVFVAEDMELHREVALKEIRAERAHDPRSRSRFLLEAEVNGRLEHPHIVPVYGLGTYSDGRPYYAMRFIQGDTLKEAIRRYHAQDGPYRDPGERSLALRQLLGQFIDVCNAVAYAHSRGVVHRDLKPSNVLLGRFGETLLVDWGLAKVVGRAETGAEDGEVTLRPLAGSQLEETLLGTTMGTPGYMSPEQAAGRLDQIGVASDVYGLGAILYAVLTGRAPVDGRDEDEVLRRVSRGDWPPPSRIATDVPAPLEAICLKAMAGHAIARYPSADTLATDVRRWMADEPVSAYQEPFLVRAARWARRRRTAVAAAAVFLATATVALAVTTALVWSAQRSTALAKQQADNERTRAEWERGQAADSFLTARSLALDISSRIWSNETGLTPDQLDRNRRAALDAALKGFDRLRAQHADDPVLLKELASLHRFAANNARFRNDMRSAEPSYQTSIQIWEELVDHDPGDATLRMLLAETLADYGPIQKRTGRLRQARETLSRAVGLAEALRESSLPQSSWRRTLATALLNRSDVEFLRGQFADVEKAAGQAAELYDALRVAPAKEKNPVDPLLAVMAVNTVAAARRETGRTDDALRAHDDAVKRMAALSGPQPSRNVAFWSALVRLERAQTTAPIPKRGGAAVEDFTEAIRTLEQLVKDNPAVPLYRRGLADAYLGRGELLLAQSAPDRAGQDLHTARERLEKLVGDYPDIPEYRGLLGRTCSSLAQHALDAGKRSEAEDWFQKADRVLQAAQKRDPDNVFHRRAASELERVRKSVKR